MAVTVSGKGQVLTSDFAASIALFSLFLILFGTVWNNSVQMFSQETNLQERQHEYSLNLLKTSGYPSDWNSSNVEIPGLYHQGYLSAEKFLELKELTDSELRKLFKAHEMHLRVEYLNGSLVSRKGRDLKVFTDSGNSFIVPRNRTVFVSSQETVSKTGDRVELRYYTWQE